MAESETEYLDQRSELAIARLRNSVRALSGQAVDAARDLQLLETARRFVVKHPFAVLSGTFAVTALIARNLGATSSTSAARAARASAQAANDAKLEVEAAEATSTKSGPTQAILGAILAPLLSFASREALDLLFPPRVGGTAVDPGGGDPDAPSLDSGSHIP